MSRDNRVFGRTPQSRRIYLGIPDVFSINWDCRGARSCVGAATGATACGRDGESRSTLTAAARKTYSFS